MDFLLEILGQILFAPIIMLLVEKPMDELENSTRYVKMPKFCRILLVVFIGLVFLTMLLAIIMGAIMLIMPQTHEDKVTGKIWLSVGLILLFLYVIAVVVCLNIKHCRESKRASEQLNGVRPDRTALRRLVHIVVDRPLGLVHPDHADIVYGVNVGYVVDVIGENGEAQEAYILGVDEPISEFDGVVVAIIHRLNDDKDEWVIAQRGCELSDEEIISKTAFQEQYYQIEIIRQ